MGYDEIIIELLNRYKEDDYVDYDWLTMEIINYLNQYRLECWHNYMLNDKGEL